MIDFVGATGNVTMNDIVTTANVIMTSLVVWRQKDKDIQIANRDETISYLKEQLEYLRSQLREKYAP